VAQREAALDALRRGASEQAARAASEVERLSRALAAAKPPDDAPSRAVVQKMQVGHAPAPDHGQGSPA
jgi:hypothetical protein